jgi:hypothetical protein
MTKYASHSWVIAGNVLVAFTTGGVMPDDVWNAMMVDLVTKPIIGYLGTSIGVVEVSSVQRRLGAESTKKRGLPSAIVTEETLVRGLVTAASWLGAKIKAFTWQELEQAVQYLGVPKSKEEIVISAVMKLKAGPRR